MTVQELKKLAKQLVAIVLIVSLVAGMQPTVAKAKESELTITNIALATPDDEESYTFYNGFNDNWYMLPGTELIVTYSDGSTKKYVTSAPLFNEKENSNGVALSGKYWKPGNGKKLVIGEEDAAGYASSYYLSEKFSIVFDEETKKVSATTGDASFSLYTAKYKNISEMKAHPQETDGTRYMKFYRVTGEAGKAYETCAPKLNSYSGRFSTLLNCYKEDGSFVSYDLGSSDDPCSVVYKFSEENGAYVIGLSSYFNFYPLYTEPYTKPYTMVKNVTIKSPKEIFPQFEACTTDYQLVWEDSHMSSSSIYASSCDYIDGAKVSFSSTIEGGKTTYGLSAVDRTGNTKLAAFPSATKVSTVEKDNSTKQQEYKAGKKIKLKPNEIKLLYADLAEGQYILPCRPCDGYDVQVYSLDNKKRKDLYFHDSTSLSGQYGILVKNTSSMTADFCLVNLLDKSLKNILQEYKTGTKMALKPYETKLMYVNFEEGLYFPQRSHSDDVEIKTYVLSTGDTNYMSTSSVDILSGEQAVLLSNFTNKAVGIRLVNLNDKTQASSLLEYKPGQEVSLEKGEDAIYRFAGSSTYEGIINNNSGTIFGIDPTEPGMFTRFHSPRGTEVNRELFLVFRSYANGTKFVIKDKLNSANNVTGPAAKETWPLPADEPQKPTNTTTTGNNTTTNNKPTTTTTKVSISGKTSTVSKVTFKATSNSAAALTKVKKATTIKSYKVPKTVTIGGKKVKVTTISANAFKGCKKLKKVTITSNVKTISANAFKNCKKLSTIVIDNAKSLKIKKNAFKGCKKITFKVKKSQMKKFMKMLKKAKIGCKYKVIKK